MQYWCISLSRRICEGALVCMMKVRHPMGNN
jgi:hypothetical protein